MSLRSSAFAAALGLACASACATSARLNADPANGPSVVVPAHFAEREGAPKASSAPAAAASPSGDAGAPALLQKPPPDPPALVTATQWLYRFRYSKGNIAVVSVARKEFDRPIPTERKVGRFAVELWVGSELVERVRFDFPLLGADPAPEGRKHPLREEVAFGPGAETSRDVFVPASDRATRAVLVDRQSGRTTTLPWPPDAPHPAENAAPSR